ATDLLEIEISDYLVRISERTNLEHALTERIRNMQTMINDLERIADIYYQITKLSDRLHESKSSWPDEAYDEIRVMMEALHQAIKNMVLNVAREPREIKLEEAIAMEKHVNKLRNQFRENHYSRLENGNYSPRAGVVFIDALNRLERIGDHVINVNEFASGHRLKDKRVTSNKRPA
ncbi:MAG: Na/Pi cotransporter family protein, partial [Marinospirillum sp.]|uniref:PhoU domain-containing protein n=1 Tax=Marinospirillum sp. TaxID=2183934 RepID=UPI0019DBCD3C